VATGCDTPNRTRQGTARASATRKVSAGARNAAVPSPLRPPSVAAKIVFDRVPEIRDFPSDERVHRIVAIDNLFQPLTVRSLTVPNRFAMAPMTRQASPGGVPGADVAEYYRRRAAGGVGLIITEGMTAAQFAGHAQMYQAVSTQAAAVHDMFVTALAASADSYAATEAANTVAAS